MIRLALVVLLTCSSWVAVAQQQEGAHGELALRLRDLVVPITAHWADGSIETGFGILVGRQGEEAVVATAGHVLAGGGPEEQATRVEIRLRQRPGRSYVGQRLVLPTTRLDLGVVAVSIPADVDWPRAVVAADPESVPRGTPVWLIGQDATWDVPTAPATVNRVSFVDREIVFDGLDVGEGTSGAPLLSSAGLLGLVVREQSNRNGGLAIFITDIEAAFREWNLPWELSGLREKPAPAPDPDRARATTQAQPGQTFTDTLNDGSPCPLCPKMVVVPGGSFTMGSPAGEAEHYDDEGPQRKVTFSEPFAIGRYEVTFAEWDACVAAGGCNGYRPDDNGWGRGSQPVINVSWQHAQAFATWLRERTGQAYQLPTEAEWEYAARAGTATPFWTGSTISTAQANYDGNYTYGGGKEGIYRQRTVAVDDQAFPANPFGLAHVHGNVLEWVQDCYRSSYEDAPSNGTEAVEVSACPGRVLRGGSWSDVPTNLRSAFRYRVAPDDPYSGIGFRVARMLTP